MKNIALIGYPKSGKTTFAKRIAKSLGFSHLSLDAIVGTFEHVFPEHGICHDEGTLQMRISSVKDFAYKWIEQNMYYNIPFVVEGYHINPEELREAYPDTLNIITLGYPNLTSEEKFKLTREFSTEPDWTLLHSDKEILEFFVRVIPEIKEFKSRMDLAGIPFFDTGEDFELAFSKVCELLGIKNSSGEHSK